MHKQQHLLTTHQLLLCYIQIFAQKKKLLLFVMNTLQVSSATSVSRCHVEPQLCHFSASDCWGMCLLYFVVASCLVFSVPSHYISWDLTDYLPSNPQSTPGAKCADENTS